MKKADLAKGRAIALSIFAAFATLAPIPRALAQSLPAAMPPASAGVAAAESPFDHDVEKAELLFRKGHLALVEGRGPEARDTFDAALDVFVEMRGASSLDPRFQPAYRNLIERIHAAEVAFGSEPRPALIASAVSPGLSPGLSPGDVEAKAEVPVNPQPQSTLAQLGDKIENIKPTDEARKANAAVLGTEVIDLPIELNDQVLGAINLYSGKFNKWFARALSRGLPHLPRIREILAEAGIPQDLAYVPIVESAFNPVALSRAKAKGLWQFIPSTGKQYGLKQDFFVDERSDMEKATVAAARYLKNLYKMFGDWNLALAGYNAGEGRVQRAIRKAQTNDFWALARSKTFRAETNNYVPLIHAAIVIAKAPASYGIDLSPEDLGAGQTIRVVGSYAIATVARCANTEAAEIRRLNPELHRGITPSSSFDLDVPEGSGERVTACLAGERAMNYTRHIIRKRDTFALIAKMFGVPASEIARTNGLSLKSKLVRGVELAIPRPRPAVPTKLAAAGAPRPGSGASYRIRKGDTLSSVAARHSTTVAAIKARNRLNSSRLSIGQLLQVTSVSSDSSNE